MRVELLLTGQAAKRVGCTRQTIHQWRRSGLLMPVLVVSGIHFFDPADVDRVAAARTHKKRRAAHSLPGTNSVEVSA